MLATASCPIKEDTSAASLHNTLAGLGPPLLLDVLDRLPELQQSARTQDDQRATYASKIVKSEAQLDWTLDAASLDRAIRAFNPFPVCFSRLGSERVKVWLASVVGTNSLPEPPGTIIRADKQGIIINCGKGQLAIQQLQLPGGKALSAEQVLNSRRELFAPGQAFSPPDESAN
jgi:methionyl-tRNA formyltransferase